MTMHSVILKYVKTRSAWEAKVKEAENKVLSTKRGCSETTKLKEDMAAWLKEEGELVKECGWATSMATKLD